MHTSHISIHPPTTHLHDCTARLMSAMCLCHPISPSQHTYTFDSPSILPPHHLHDRHCPAHVGDVPHVELKLAAVSLTHLINAGLRASGEARVDGMALGFRVCASGLRRYALRILTSYFITIRAVKCDRRALDLLLRSHSMSLRE